VICCRLPVSQPDSGTKIVWPSDDSELHQSGFAVICSHALNSLCSRRLCSRLARSRLISVASSPLAARRTCASELIVLLADSAIGPGQLAVIATPSRIRRPRTSPAALPAFRRLRPALFALSSCAHWRVCSCASTRRSGEYVISCRLLWSSCGQRKTIARGLMFRAGWV
jgi:hypothetical protein